MRRCSVRSGRARGTRPPSCYTIVLPSYYNASSLARASASSTVVARTSSRFFRDACRHPCGSTYCASRGEIEELVQVHASVPSPSTIFMSSDASCTVSDSPSASKKDWTSRASRRPSPSSSKAANASRTSASEKSPSPPWTRTRPRPRPRDSRVARPNASAPPRRRRRGGRRRPSGVAGRRARRRRPRCPPRLTQTRRSPRSRRPCTGTPTERCRGRRRTRTRGAPRPTSCWRGVAGEARCPAHPRRRNRRTRRGTSTRGVFARVVRSTRGARLAPQPWARRGRASRADSMAPERAPREPNVRPTARTEKKNRAKAASRERAVSESFAAAPPPHSDARPHPRASRRLVSLPSRCCPPPRASASRPPRASLPRLAAFPLVRRGLSSRSPGRLVSSSTRPVPPRTTRACTTAPSSSTCTPSSPPPNQSSTLSSRAPCTAPRWRAPIPPTRRRTSTRRTTRSSPSTASPTGIST